MIKKLFIVLFAVSVLAAFFLAALNSDQVNFPKIQNFFSTTDAKIKTVKENQARANKEWQEMMDVYQRDREEQADLIASLGENAQRLIGHSQEIGDMREILFAKILNRQADQSQSPSMQDVPAAPSEQDNALSDKKGFNKDQVAVQLQDVNKKESDLIEKSRQDYNAAIERFNELQGQQQTVVENLVKDSAASGTEQIMNDFQTIVDQQAALIQQSKKQYDDLIAAAQQIQQQNNDLMQSLLAQQKDQQDQIKQKLQDLRDQQKSLLENRKLELTRLMDQQHQLQQKNDQLIQDLIAASKFNQQLSKERQEAMLDQQKDILNNQTATMQLNQSIVDQKLKMNDLKQSQQDIKDRQDQQRQLLKDSRGF